MVLSLPILHPPGFELVAHLNAQQSSPGVPWPFDVASGSQSLLALGTRNGMSPEMPKENHELDVGYRTSRQKDSGEKAPRNPPLAFRPPGNIVYSMSRVKPIPFKTNQGQHKNTHFSHWTYSSLLEGTRCGWLWEANRNTTTVDVLRWAKAPAMPGIRSMVPATRAALARRSLHPADPFAEKKN